MEKRQLIGSIKELGVKETFGYIGLAQTCDYEIKIEPKTVDIPQDDQIVDDQPGPYEEEIVEKEEKVVKEEKIIPNPPPPDNIDK